jgi:ABC-2 type transport system ATP-binding protein
MEHILSLKDVVKTYDKKMAVDHVSFDVPKGSIFGLLGPNGAGKTSLIRIITTITRADTGQILLDGEPLNSRHPEQIGYMPEERGLYKKMKVGEQLIYLGRLKGLDMAETKKSIRYWMEKFEITDWWNKKVEELSKGMQQKVQFIATVLHDPKLLILDEPFTGLDPINSNLLKAEIEELKQKGTSIIFSTHRMEQVEEICDNIVLINQGKNILDGSVAAIKDQYKLNRFELQYAGDKEVTLPEKVEVISHKAGSVMVQLADDGNSNDLLRHFLDQQVKITNFHEILPSINEIFIKQVEDSNSEVK